MVGGCVGFSLGLMRFSVEISGDNSVYGYDVIYRTVLYVYDKGFMQSLI